MKIFGIVIMGRKRYEAMRKLQDDQADTVAGLMKALDKFQRIDEVGRLGRWPFLPFATRRDVLEHLAGQRHSVCAIGLLTLLDAMKEELTSAALQWENVNERKRYAYCCGAADALRRVILDIKRAFNEADKMDEPRCGWYGASGPGPNVANGPQPSRKYPSGPNLGGTAG